MVGGPPRGPCSPSRRSGGSPSAGRAPGFGSPSQAVSVPVRRSIKCAKRAFALALLGLLVVASLEKYAGVRLFRPALLTARSRRLSLQCEDAAVEDSHDAHAEAHEVSAVGGPSHWESGSGGTSAAPTTTYVHDEWEVYTHVATDTGDHDSAHSSASGSLQQSAASGSHGSTTIVAHGQQRHNEGGAEHTGDVEIEDSLASMLSMVLVGYVVCAALEYFNQILPGQLRVQLSCVIFLVGGLIFFIVDAIAAEGHDFEVLLAGHNSLAYLNPHALFYVILPPLLYESASGTPWHVLRKVLASSIILAFPGVVVNTALTAVMAKPILTDFRDHAVPWEILFLLSSILSATDPVAVLAALRTLGAPPKLSSLIEGESLLNDGSAYVVFLVFNDLASASAPAEEKMCATTDAAGCIIGNFLRLAAGGSLLGVGAGLVVTVWIQRARFVNSAALEVTIVLIGVYGSFFVAERLECSGVLAVVVFGITSSAMLVSKLSNEASHAHHKVVSLLGYICDKMIFFAAGMICARFLSVPIRCAGEVSGQLVASMFGRIFALYIILHIARIIMVIVFAPLLTKLGYGCTWREGYMLVFAGLRGALALCMGLVVLHNQYISRGDANAVGFYTSGIVFLTLMLNGSLVEPFFKWLNLYPPNQHRIGRLTRQLNKVEAQLQHGLFRKLYSHWFFKDCRFESILQCVPNLSKVDFEPETGRPIPTAVISTRRTLNDLESLAANYRNDILSQQEARYEMDFQTEWRARHEALTQDVINWLIETSFAPCLVEPASGDPGPTTDLPQRPISTDSGITLTSGTTSNASTAVSASLAPELRQGADRMHEIYMTLFKAVLWQYRKRHEHGIIGDWALSWLVEAANEAMDCANQETNARRILDFADTSHWRGSLRATRELQDALDRQLAAGPTGAAADPAAVTNSLSALGRVALTAGDRPKPGLFEPLIVQYLIIEEMCSKSSPTERYPRAWRGAKFVRSFGYNRTRARVESLYVYIEGLEKVVHKFKELEQYPGIYLLVQRLIDAAKKDLDIIMVLNPRQFFFCKHALALKIILSKRLHKLEEEAEQGWIAPGDAEGLVHDTRTRLAKVELHVPNLRTSWLFRSIERRAPSLKRSSSKELQETVQESWSSVITELFRADAVRAASKGSASGPRGAHADRGGAGTELGTKASDGDQAVEPATEPPERSRWRDRAKTGRSIVSCCYSRFRVLSFLF